MSSVFAKPILWHWLTRSMLFWLVAFALIVTMMTAMAPLSAAEFSDILAEAAGGTMDRVSTRAFAFTLAALIGSTALGLGGAHFVSHVLLVRLSIRAARRHLEAEATKAEFASAHDRLLREMGEHPLLGRAWQKFAETLVHHDGRLYNTIRPQTFFSGAALRDKVSGLKWLPSEPGYFVGVGLLLTFIGLVIALSKAAAGTAAASEGGQGAAAMQTALRELLQAATFKFSTSIAGLAASIALSIVYRAYSIGIESSLQAFCDALDARLDYLPPQSVSVEMRDRLTEQVIELETITGGAFAARLGTEMAPHMRAAMEAAIEPLADRIGEAVGRLSDDSRSGVQDLVSRFTDTVQGGAGTELRELTAGLRAMLGAMEQARADVGRSGEDFSRRMTDAAETLNRLVGAAGRDLGAQSAASRDTLDGMLVSLREMFDRASRQVDDTLAGAADGASDRLTGAMDRVLGRLETQVSGLGRSLVELRESATTHVAETQSKVAAAQEQGVATIGEASARAAAALERGLGDALKTIHTEVETLSSALRRSSSALGEQARAVDTAATRSRETAEVLGRSAEAVRAAVEPVTRSNERIAEVTSSVGAALEKAGAALGDGQRAATALTTAIDAQVGRLTALWADYQQRFGQVDETLARAFDKLATETTKQSQILADRTGQIDRALAEAIDRLDPAIREVGEGAGDLAESVDELKKLMAQRATLR